MHCGINVGRLLVYHEKPANISYKSQDKKLRRSSFPTCAEVNNYESVDFACAPSMRSATPVSFSDN